MRRLCALVGWVCLLGCVNARDVPIPHFYDYWQRAPDGVGPMGTPQSRIANYSSFVDHRRSSMTRLIATSIMQPSVTLPLCTASCTVLSSWTPELHQRSGSPTWWR